MDECLNSVLRWFWLWLHILEAFSQSLILDPPKVFFFSNNSIPRHVLPSCDFFLNKCPHEIQGSVKNLAFISFIWVLLLMRLRREHNLVPSNGKGMSFLKVCISLQMGIQLKIAIQVQISSWMRKRNDSLLSAYALWFLFPFPDALMVRSSHCIYMQYSVQSVSDSAGIVQ